MVSYLRSTMTKLACPNLLASAAAMVRSMMGGPSGRLRCLSCRLSPSSGHAARPPQCRSGCFAAQLAHRLLVGHLAVRRFRSAAAGVVADASSCCRLLVVAAASLSRRRCCLAAAGRSAAVAGSAGPGSRLTSPRLGQLGACPCLAAVLRQDAIHASAWSPRVVAAAGHSTLLAGAGCSLESQLDDP